MPFKLSPTQIAFNARGDGKFNKPFKEQVKFFRQKINLPTERYDDVLKSAHDRAFVVAGAMKADLLQDFRSAIDQAISDGKSIGWFRKEFENITQKHGWLDYTGSDTKKGRAWRTRVIYNTNISASYAAGRYQQLKDPDLLKNRPYWKYVHNDTVQHPRPLHQAWSGLVLHHDDSWWDTHYPPNGWGCRCRVTAVTAKEYHGAKPKDEGVYTRVDSAGDKHVIPKGIDYGWDYAPGSKTDLPLRNLVQDKLIRYPAAIARALSRDINKQISASRDIVDFAERALNEPTKEMFFAGFVDNFEEIDRVVNAGISLKGFLVLLTQDAVRHANKSHKFDGGGQRPVTPEDFAFIAEILSFPDDVKKGKKSRFGNNTIEIWKKINGERFRLVFEIFHGKRRNLRLLSITVKER